MVNGIPYVDAALTHILDGDRISHNALTGDRKYSSDYVQMQLNLHAQKTKRRPVVMLFSHWAMNSVTKDLQLPVKIDSVFIDDDRTGLFIPPNDIEPNKSIYELLKKLKSDATIWVSFQANTYGWQNERASCDNAKEFWNLTTFELSKVMRYSQYFFDYMNKNDDLRGLFPSASIGHRVLGWTANYSRTYDADESNFVDMVLQVLYSLDKLAGEFIFGSTSTTGGYFFDVPF